MREWMGVRMFTPVREVGAQFGRSLPVREWMGCSGIHSRCSGEGLFARTARAGNGCPVGASVPVRKWAAVRVCIPDADVDGCSGVHS